jgi:hypothetical protein
MYRRENSQFHLFCVGTIHKPGGTYRTALRRAKEKFCIDVHSKIVANSSNATMLRIFQLSTVLPTFLKRKHLTYSKGTLDEGLKFFSYKVL